MPSQFEVVAASGAKQPAAGVAVVVEDDDAAEEDEEAGVLELEDELGDADTVKLSAGALLPPTDHVSDQLPTVPAVAVADSVKTPLPFVEPYGVVPSAFPFCVAVFETGEFAGPVTVNVQVSPTAKG